LPRGKPNNPNGRGPLMKATLERHMGAEPSAYHYQAAKHALQKSGITIDSSRNIPRAANVKDLAIWVDSVLWCGGDQNARNALLDRMMAKEARLIVNAEIESRANLSHNSTSVDEAATYMDMLERDVKS